jgi:hypothetical protein
MSLLVGVAVISAILASSNKPAIVCGALATTMLAICGCKPAKIANLVMFSSGVAEILLAICFMAVT